MRNKTRLRYRMPDGEMQRRWTLVKKLMTEKDLDVVVCQNSNLFLGGYVRWFTDVPAENNIQMSVLFYPSKEITLLCSGATNLEPYPPVECRRENFTVKNVPYNPGISFTANAEANVVIDELKARECKRIGYIAPSMLPVCFMDRLRGAIYGAEFIDVTDEIDLLKAIKSEDEMVCIRKTAAIQDYVWCALPSIIRPGMKEYAIRAELVELTANLGSEEHLIFLGSNKPGKPCGTVMFQYANRTIEKGDYGMLLLEVSGPGGYYCESARNFSLGEPTDEMMTMWNLCVESQDYIATLMKPGMDSRDVVRIYNKYVEERGYGGEDRLLGHSQGYDLIERPAFMIDHEWGNEPMPILEGMNVSTHPLITTPTCAVYVNNNYYISATGAIRLHKSPSEWIII